MGARSLHNLATTVRDAPKLRDALLEAEQAGRSAANAARIHIGRKHFDPPRECKDEALWLADFLHTRGLTAFKAGINVQDPKSRRGANEAIMHHWCPGDQVQLWSQKHRAPANTEHLQQLASALERDFGVDARIRRTSARSTTVGARQF